MKTCIVIGAHGFIAVSYTHLDVYKRQRLKSAFPKAEIIGVGRRDADLLEPGAPARLLRNTQPDCVVHMAAKSGGIITNIKRPAEFFYENVVMNTHMLHDAQQAGVKKFVTFMGGCSYPVSYTHLIPETRKDPSNARDTARYGKAPSQTTRGLAPP